MFNLKAALIKLGILREDAIETIHRAKDEIAFVTARNVSVIEQAVDAELSVIRYTVSDAFERITDLMSTGAVSAKLSETLQKAQKDIFTAIEAVDAAV